MDGLYGKASKGNVLSRSLEYPAQSVTLAHLQTDSEYQAAYDIFVSHRYHPWTFQTFKETIIQNRHFIAVHNRKVVGFCIFSILYETSELLDIAVDTSAQGNGVGKKLMRACIEECQREAEHLILEVAANNHTAVSLYHAFGFKKIHTRPDYYDSSSGRIDAYIMEKLFRR